MLEWQENNGNWLLYDNNQYVAMITFGFSEEDMDYGYWNGTFYTSDKGSIVLERISEWLDVAKRYIEDCYKKQKPYSWWMR